MAKPENFVRAAFGAMIFMVGCGEVQPRTIPDNTSARVISAAPPKPEATSIRPAFLKTNKGFILSSPGWHLYKNKLGITNWSGTDLDFDNQGLDYLLEQCALNEFPGLVGVKLVKSHPWSFPVDITFGAGNINVSLALETLKDEADPYLEGSVCVAVTVGKQRREGKSSTNNQIWDQIVAKTKALQNDIETGEVPRVITTGPSS